MYRWPFAAALALAAGTAAAQDDFNLEETVRFCASCHGEAGIPVNPEYPILWGQEYFYLFTQLRDYGAARRDNPVMTPIAARFDRAQAKALAQYFAAQTWPKIQATAQDGDEQITERAATGGQCSACHGTWHGNSNVPRLAGQQVGYLQKTMQDFKHEVRNNAPDKISTMQKLDDGTIAAVARYLSTL